MDVFEKIEEYERKVSAKIRNKLNLFTSMMYDREIFDRMFNNTSADVSLESGTNEIINEIKSDSIIIQLLIINLRERGEKGETLKNKTIFKDLRPKGFTSREFGSNLSISNYANYFDQKQIKMNKMNSQFYLKSSELNLTKIKLAEEFMTQIKKKLYIAFNDSLSNVKQQKFNEEDNEDNTNTNINIKINTFEIKKMIEHSINHLYPLKREKEDFMNEDLLQEKMIEYHFSGKLSKQVNLQDIMHDYKISEKKKLNDNFNIQMNLTNLLVDSYNDIKALNSIKKKKIGKRVSIQLEGVSNSKDNFVYTRSKMYVKLNRNREDLKLSSNKANKKNQLPPVLVKRFVINI